MKKMKNWKICVSKANISQQKEKLREYFNKNRLKSAGIDLFFLLAACSAGAFATVGVLLPNGLTSGGVTGVVRIIQHYIPVDFSLLYYGGSLLILILVFVFLGFREGRKIILLTIMYPAVLMIFERLNIQLLQQKDVLLAAIFCGVFNGVCIGLVFWRGYSFSGTDALAKILRKKLFPQFSISKILLVIDGVIITCSAFLFGRNIALYALITQVILSRMADMVIYGFETKIVQLHIITSEVEAVTDYIIEDIGRGVSSEKVVGEYTQKKYTHLNVLCSPRESMLVKKHIAKLDSTAFVTVIPVESVWGRGEGFDDISKA
jgi:uncharacterized membrane-anchored protein YitT (DUF2179 family)